MTVKVTTDNLGNHLGGLRDLTQQLGDLLSSPAPGGIVAKRDELLGMISQAQQLVDEATGQLNELEGLTGLLTQYFSTILGALGQVGITKIEFTGDVGTVSAEHAQAMQQSAGGAVVYGFTIMAATPDAQKALDSLLGTGKAITDKLGI